MQWMHSLHPHGARRYSTLTDTPGALAVAGRARSGLVGLIPARPQQQRAALSTRLSARVSARMPPPMHACADRPPHVRGVFSRTGSGLVRIADGYTVYIVSHSVTHSYCHAGVVGRRRYREKHFTQNWCTPPPPRRRTTTCDHWTITVTSEHDRDGGPMSRRQRRWAAANSTTMTRPRAACR